MKKTTLLAFLLFNTPFMFSQVIVDYKCNGEFIGLEYKSYKDCECQNWTVDYFKEGEKKPWGLARNTDREKLKAEIKAAIDSDYNTWHKTKSDHEIYVIYCSKSQFCEDYKNFIKEKKPSSVDGVVIEPEPSTKVLDFGKFRRVIKKNPDKIEGHRMDQPDSSPADAMGRRGDNTTPNIQVESMSLSTEEPVKRKTTTKKK